MTVEAPRRRYYVDTSAWLAVALGEPSGPALAAELSGAELVSSVLLVTEMHRNLVRLARSRQLTTDQLYVTSARIDADLAMFELQDLTLALARSRELPVVTTPRSLDLIHLRTALLFHRERPLTRFVSLDIALTSAAQEMGLPI
jgi:predicted nucleic acid-binding protein